MPLVASENPDQSAWMVDVEFCHVMSEVVPSFTVPGVGAVVSTVMPLDVATELTFPTASVARTDTK